MAEYLLGMLPSVITGMAVFFLQRRQKHRDRELEQRSSARREEILLTMELQIANADLAYATAIAYKTGKANGEMSAAMEAYGEAKEKWLAFMRRQAAEHLVEE